MRRHKCTKRWSRKKQRRSFGDDDGAGGAIQGVPPHSQMPVWSGYGPPAYHYGGYPDPYHAAHCGYGPPQPSPPPPGNGFYPPPPGSSGHPAYPPPPSYAGSALRRPGMPRPPGE